MRPGSLPASLRAASIAAEAIRSRSSQVEMGKDRSIAFPVVGFQAWKVPRSDGAFTQVPAVSVVDIRSWYRADPSTPYDAGMSKQPPPTDPTMIHPPELRFLEGPQNRKFELGRLLRISAEFLRGFRRLHFVGPCVTVFGSARFEEDNRWYQLARETSGLLARCGFTVMTGGGPGIMEAANRGAREAGGRSIAATIELPHEQGSNPYLDLEIPFHYFFVRKVMLVKYSYAFIVMPGGFGTMDELWEIATLVQTRKVRNFPIILMGREYWEPMIDFLRERMVSEGTISPDDPDHLILTDDPEEAARIATGTGLSQFGLTYGPQAEPNPLLLERAIVDRR